METVIRIMVFVAGCIILFGALLEVFWVSGLMVLQKRTAVLYIEKRKRKEHKCSVRFKSCNGIVKRVLNLRETRTYKFTLTSELNNGSVTVEIQNKQKQPVATLNAQNTEVETAIDQNERYYLLFRFEHADGSFEFGYQ